MFLINKDSNIISPLSKKSFTELGFKERAHLQEWIANNPECLGEKLLIIQKEFSGFADTYERLDLLALDYKGNIVIIENKLDDSGKDVTWQAMKYASYASTLTKEQITTIYQSYLDTLGGNGNAVEKLVEFFDNVEFPDLVLNQRLKQRIIMIAANFRKEVTSTVLWLMNFEIQLQCFKATVFELETQHLLSLEQIIPTKDTQDFIISMSNKIKEELTTEEDVKNRHKLRLDFWGLFLKEIKGKSVLFQNSNPTKDHWLVAGGTGISGLSYQLIITYNNASVMLNFARPNTQENKALFDELYKYKDTIDTAFGEGLNWERLNDRKSSRVSFTKVGVNYFNREDWTAITSFLLNNINALESAIRPHINSIKTSLNNIDIEATTEPSI